MRTGRARTWSDASTDRHGGQQQGQKGDAEAHRGLADQIVDAPNELRDRNHGEGKRMVTCAAVVSARGLHALGALAWEMIPA